MFWRKCYQFTLTGVTQVKQVTPISNAANFNRFGRIPTLQNMSPKEVLIVEDSFGTVIQPGNDAQPEQVRRFTLRNQNGVCVQVYICQH